MSVINEDKQAWIDYGRHIEANHVAFYDDGGPFFVFTDEDLKKVNNLGLEVFKVEGICECRS